MFYMFLSSNIVHVFRWRSSELLFCRQHFFIILKLSNFFEILKWTETQRALSPPTPTGTNLELDLCCLHPHLNLLNCDGKQLTEVADNTRGEACSTDKYITYVKHQVVGCVECQRCDSSEGSEEASLLMLLCAVLTFGKPAVSYNRYRSNPDDFLFSCEVMKLLENQLLFNQEQNTPSVLISHVFPGYISCIFIVSTFNYKWQYLTVSHQRSNRHQKAFYFANEQRITVLMRQFLHVVATTCHIKLGEWGLRSSILVTQTLWSSITNNRDSRVLLEPKG